MILPKIKVLHSHGSQYIPDLCRVELTEEFRGRPILTQSGSHAVLEAAAQRLRSTYSSIQPVSDLLLPVIEHND
ncbi:MAG: hypothetical protein RR318_05470 [Alistipes sp.]